MLWSLSLAHRKRLAQLILILACSMAIYVAIPGDGIGVPPAQEEGQQLGWIVQVIDHLNALNWVHLMGHWAIFGGIAFLLGEWGQIGERGSSRLAWSYVIVGALAMEAGQALVGYADDTPRTLLESTLFDLATDGLAAWLGLWLARYWMNRLPSLQSENSQGSL